MFLLLLLFMHKSPVIQGISIEHGENAALIKTPGFLEEYFITKIRYFRQEDFHTLTITQV